MFVKFNQQRPGIVPGEIVEINDGPAAIYVKRGLAIEVSIDDMAKPNKRTRKRRRKNTTAAGGDVDQSDS